MFRKALVLASMGLLLTAGAALAGTPFGGDDSGFLPPGGSKGAVGKCETAISKAASKAVACIFKCHDSRASGKLADDQAEENCESRYNNKGCGAKYVVAAEKVFGHGGCPTCVGDNFLDIEASAEVFLDGVNGFAYCASPSGAFVDGVASF